MTATTKTKGSRARGSRRGCILDVAQRAFLETGYAATTMSGIAAEVGGSKATLWNHFPSKEDLFAAVVKRATGQFREELQIILDTSAPLPESLLRFAEHFLEQISTPEKLGLYRLMIAECARFAEIGTIFYENGPAQTHRMLADFLEVHMNAGMLRRENPLRTARTLVSLCSGGFQHRLLFNAETVSDDRIRDEARFVVDTFLRAFAPEPMTG